MVELGEEYQGVVKADNRRKNPEAHKLLRSGQKSKYYSLRIPSRDPYQSGYRNCKYIRYADDFLVGIVGPRSMAVEITRRIEVFLRDNLKVNLSMDKTKITHISKGVPFLGYKFGRKSLFTTQRYGKKVVMRKMTIPTLDVNLKRVIERLAQAGFCDGSGEPKPTFRFLRLPQSEINMKVNRILRGLSEWWSIAGNRQRAIAYAAYIIRYSIAKVYAAKFKLKTVAAVFKIGGNNLSKPIGVRVKSVVGASEQDTPKRKKAIEGILFDRYHKIPKPKGNKMKLGWKPEYLEILDKANSIEELVDYLKVTNTTATSKNPLVRMGWRLERGISRQGAPCDKCGSYEGVQMHHVRHLKDIDQAKTSRTKSKIAIERRQIPLCRKHHLEMHKGD